MSDGGEATNVKVMVRVRPFSSREIGLSKRRKERLNCAVRMRGDTCVILEHTVDDQGFTIEKEREAFQFNNCFWSIPLEQETEPSGNKFATQETVYNESGKIALDAAFDGFNTCIFAYGQTGSGKTHSMLGSDTDPGVSPRLVDDLFRRIEERKRTIPTTKCQVEVMFFEIYNEKVRDLFADAKKRAQNYEPPRIRQHPTKGVFVEGLKRRAVTNAEETKGHMEHGASERAMTATKMNATSSRSHAVFQLQLTQMDALKGTQKVSTINLVDLAGSEKVKQSEVEGDAFNEARNINKSLSTLRRVIDTLIENAENKRQKPPPFRESVLTYLLSDSLGGNSKTMMISAISPHESNIEDTLNTLRYAQRAKAIVCNAKVNEERNAEMMDAMKDELLELRRKLASGEALPGSPGGGQMLPEEIEAQIKEKEEEMQRMEEQQQEMTIMVEQARKEKEEYEEKLHEAATVVSTQKRERFAAAFRNAFLIAQDKKRIEASTKELEEARAEAAHLRGELRGANDALDAKQRELIALEDRAEEERATAAKERVQAAEEAGTLQRQVRGLQEDKAALQRRIDEAEHAVERAQELKLETEKRLAEMQDDMMAMGRKVEQAAAEKAAVVERLEQDAREAALQADDLRRRRERHRQEAAEKAAEADALRRAFEELSKDREQLLATVKAQQQLLNERSGIIEQLHAQTREHKEAARAAERRAEDKADEVRVLLEALREYEAAAGKWMSEHTQKDRELQQLRMHVDGSRILRAPSASTPVRAHASASPHAARYSTLTPRRTQSPTASSVRSPVVRQPSVQQYPLSPTGASPRPRWA